MERHADVVGTCTDMSQVGGFDEVRALPEERVNSEREEEPGEWAALENTSKDQEEEFRSSVAVGKGGV